MLILYMLLENISHLIYLLYCILNGEQNFNIRILFLSYSMRTISRSSKIHLQAVSNTKRNIIRGPTTPEFWLPKTLITTDLHADERSTKG